VDFDTYPTSPSARGELLLSFPQTRPPPSEWDEPSVLPITGSIYQHGAAHSKFTHVHTHTYICNSRSGFHYIIPAEPQSENRTPKMKEIFGQVEMTCGRISPRWFMPDSISHLKLRTVIPGGPTPSTRKSTSPLDIPGLIYDQNALAVRELNCHRCLPATTTSLLF